MFELGTAVVILASGETGQVIGKANYLHGEDQYLIRYKSADGRAVEAWWGLSALKQ